MKSSLTNLILLVAVFAILIASWIDRTRLKADLADLAEKDATRVIGFREFVEGITGVQPLYLTHHKEEQQLQDVLNNSNFSARYSRPTDTALEILALCKSYDRFDDKELPNAFIRGAMRYHDWHTPEDVLEWIHVRCEFAEEMNTKQTSMVIDNAVNRK